MKKSLFFAIVGFVAAVCLPVSSATADQWAITVPDAGFDDHVLNNVGDYIYIGNPGYTGAWKSDYGDGGAYIDYNYWDGDLPARSGHLKAYPSDAETFDYIYQILDETFIEGGTYTLSVWVGNAWPGEGYADGWGLYFTGEDYKINLIEAHGLALLGDWEQVSLVYTATAADAGKKIGIKMSGEQGESYIAFEDVTLSYDGPPSPRATMPIPADGAEHDDVRVTLIWTPGATAVKHDVYFGTDFDDVKDATASEPPVDPYKGRQTDASYEVNDLVPGTTYYWRIDEVEADGATIHKGKVWSFWLAPWEAYNPSPPDGAKFIVPDANLSWSPGLGAVTHDVYLGTSYDDVKAGTGGTFKGNQPLTTYDPCTLEFEKVYYWRVDELDGSATHTGNVWRFTTHSRYASGVTGQYYNDMTFTNLVLTRIDPGIDFSWGDGSPDLVVNADNFSVRWSGDLEAPFSEPFTFITASDDGVRLYLDGRLIIDNWTDHARTEDSSAPVELVAGRSYTIVMEYYENTGGAIAQLYWQSPSQPRQIIPQFAFSLPLRARNPRPAWGATDVEHTPKLMWVAGEKAANHDVYFGTDPTPGLAEFRGQQTATSYVPTEAPLQWNTIYYWRIDEVNGVDLWPGSVWSFTTANNKVVDNFETYEDSGPVAEDINWIYFFYTDGFGDLDCTEGTGNGSGAKIALQRPGQGGSSLAMTFQYDNDGMVKTPADCNPSEPEVSRAYYSKAEALVAKLPSGIGSDWTLGGVAKALSLQFYGDPLNSIEPMWVQLTDVSNNKATVFYGAYADEDVNDVNEASWHEWLIDLADFTGVNVSNVKSMAIGIGSETGPAGGSGTLYFDDIRLYTTRCVLTRRSADFAIVDYVQDCAVDYKEVEAMAENWLVQTTAPADANLVGWWTFDEGEGTTALDRSDHDNHGTLQGDPEWVAGCVDGALNFDGSGDYVDIGYSPELSLNEFTVSAWVNIAAEPGTFGVLGTRVGGDTTFDLKVQRTMIHGDIGDGSGWINTAIDIESNHTGTTGQGGDLAVDTWYMITYVIDNTNQQVRLYLDADLKRTITISGTPLLMKAGQSMWIGDTGTGTEGMNGLIDDVRIYNVALSDVEILGLGLLGLQIDLYEDMKIDFKDFAVLGDRFLNEEMFP